MSRDDAPDFRISSPTESCRTCKHNFYIVSVGCEKYNFDYADNCPDIVVCNGWEK